MINELLNSILTCVLIADVIERRFPSEFQSFVVEISYNCIYLFSKFQIFLSNSNTKLNNIIDNNNTLLKIKSDIKHLLKPTIPTIPIAQEFIKDGKQVELLNEGLFYGSETDYDFSIVSWADETNNYINKKLDYDKDPNIISLSTASDMKFILIEIKIGDNNPYKIDLKTDKFNYYLVENKFNKQFFIFYLQNYLEIKEIKYDEKINLKIIDQDVNTFEIEFTDKNESFVLEKNGYKFINYLI